MSTDQGSPLPRGDGIGLQTTLLAGIREAIDTHQYAYAEELLRAFLSKYPRHAEAYFLRAVVAERTRKLAEALAAARASLAIRVHPEPLMIISRVMRIRGDTDAALDACDRALSMRPGCETWLIHRAGTLEEAGRFAEARQVVDPLVSRCEREGMPLSHTLRYELAKLLVQERSYDRAVEVLDELFTQPSTPEQLTRVAWYLKAKALDRSGQYDASFAAATRGNDIGRLEFDPALYEQQVSLLIDTWSAERIEKFPHSNCKDELPVFIAGMPRSGTSLIDQIIDAHPLAAGVGELASIEMFAAKLSRSYNPDLDPPHCFVGMGAHAWSRAAREYVRQVRRLAPDGVHRVVNKALGNNKLVGLLARLFPKTRIIHAIRDPRDIAISCYMGGFNNRVHPWTTRLEWVAVACEQSHRLMEHWKSVLGVPILDVHYECLVADPDEQFPRLIEFLGLPWDPACREFYKSRRTVRTLSYDQVNRPLYTGSAGRHLHYRKHLAESRAFEHTDP